MVIGGAATATIVGACTKSECTQPASETGPHQYWIAAGELQAHAIYRTYTSFAENGMLTIVVDVHRKHM